MPCLPSSISCKDYSIKLDHTLIMGILNVTPDSFSDGGKFLDPKKAVERALTMAGEGADIIDVGGESTRPGSLPVSLDEELERVIPVIRGIAKKTKTPISIDTTKSAVAEAALKAGARIINDTSGLEDDPKMAGIAIKFDSPVIVMHRKGTPKEMQSDPRYDDVISEITAYFKKRISFLKKCGIKEDKILIDPGIGFGKTVEHNLRIIRELEKLIPHSRPVVIGVSRKSFIGRILDGAPAEKRLLGSLAAAARAVTNGAKIVRTHDVKETKEFFRIFDAIRQ